MVIIGYSFSHPSIRDLVKDALTTGSITKLGLFSPNPEKILDTIFPEENYPAGKVILLPGHFGEDDGLFTIIKWLREYGITKNDKNEIKSISATWRNRRESQYIRESRTG